MRDVFDEPPQGTVAERLARAARAAQQLCDALWETLHEELRNPDSERVRELSARLAEVSSTVALLAASAPRSASVDGSFAEPQPAGAPRPAEAAASRLVEAAASRSTEDTAPSVETPESGPSVVERRTPPEPSSKPDPPTPDSRTVPDLRLAPHPPSAAEPRRVEPAGVEPVGVEPVRVEPERVGPSHERRSASEPRPFERSTTSELPSTQRLPPEPESPVPHQPIPTRAGDYTFTKLVDEHRSPSSVEPVEHASAEIEIRDVRREEGPSAWVSSVGRLL
ncbi:MAG TPA: hypothetical protein VK781_11730, partial [Solirubrobacteraceae bacterium]|nr:hypothetical protein [Solirubrobacteraceae bacterium]